MKVKVIFKVPVQIATEVGGNRRNLKPGIHELDEEVANHWFVQGLITADKAVMVKEKSRPTVKPESTIINTIKKPSESLSEVKSEEALKENILGNVEIKVSEKPKEVVRLKRGR